MQAFPPWESKRRAGRAGLLLPFLCLFLGLWTGGRADGAPAASCEQCHDQGKKLVKSAHASLTCDTCHEKHETYPHPADAPKAQCAACHEDQRNDFSKSVHAEELKKGNAGAPDCAMCHWTAHELQKTKTDEFRAALPDQCGMCHTDIASQFKVSIHGRAVEKGVPQAPTCMNCHGSHAILRHTNTNSPVHATHVRETCAGCHGNVQLSRQMKMPADRIVSFDESFHGLAAKAGSQTVANCASCHGVHNILPSTDEKSTIFAKNLPQTCGKCHPGAGKKFAITQIHVIQGRDEAKALGWIREIYSVLIPLTVGLMLLHNLGDWIRKLFQLRSRRLRELIEEVEEAEHRPVMRMYPLERVQHALTALSFMALVWTGFALKYPDAWWAQPLVATESVRPIRSIAHRIAAVIFILTSVMHLVTLMVSKKHRHHWMEMLPKLSDASEAVAGFLYNVGLRSAKPPRSAHSYVEKAEYWAVVWGAIIMAGTGIALWANNWMLARFPKLWLDIATSVHFYEAVLATLAIAVWHFYSAIFDPDVYPLDTAWYSGYSVRKHKPHDEEEAGEQSDPARG